MSTVQVIPYSERWPHEFRHVAATLRDVLGDLAVRIDHIGSTSVPGLAAKDVLDVQVAVASLDIERLLEPFSRAGFELVERNDRDHIPGGRAPLTTVGGRSSSGRAPPGVGCTSTFVSPPRPTLGMRFYSATTCASTSARRPPTPS